MVSLTRELSWLLYVAWLMPSHQAGLLFASLPLSQSSSCLTDLTEPSWPGVGISDPASAPQKGSPGAQMAHPKRTKNTHPQTVLRQGLRQIVTNKPDLLGFVTKLPNHLIFQAEDLPCMGSSFSLLPCMQLMTLCRVIITPGFIHLTLSISDLDLPSHPGLQSHRSQQHSSILGAILRLNGPCPTPRTS